MGCCTPTCSLITIISSMFIGLIGVALKGYLPNLVESTIMKSMVLSKTSMIYDFWVEPPVCIYTKFYVFNYTNYEEFISKWDKGVRPKVEQLGPYVYRHFMRKRNITFINANEVEYYLDQELVFIPELSNGTEADMAIFPNIVLRGIVQSEMAKEDILGTIELLKMCNDSNEPFVKKSISSFLLDGYYDPMIEKLYENTGLMTPDGIFSVMKRYSETGPIRIKTGANKTRDLGTIVEYQNRKLLDYWPTNSTCNLIKGTDGLTFAPRLPIGEKLFIFLSEFCRSIFLRFDKQVEHHGIKANRFVLDTEAMSNTNNEYECFCKSSINKCWASGVFNLGQCKNGTQILLSQPHFLNADYKIKNDIEGLAPNLEQHQFYMDLEVIISLPLNVSSSLQVNLGVERTPHIKSADKLPRIILPIFWMSEVVELNETMSERLKSSIIEGPGIVTNLVPKVTLALSGVICLLGISCATRQMLKTTKKRAEPWKEKTIVHSFAY